MLLDGRLSIAEWLLLTGALLATGVTLSRQVADLRAAPATAQKPANPTRKVVHMLLGTLVVCLWVPRAYQWIVPVIWLLGFFIGWLVFAGRNFSALAWGASEESGAGVRDTGIVAYPTVMLWSSLLQPPIATALLLTYLAIGDGLASLLGSGSGPVSPLPWNRAKSWRGFWAFIVGSGMVAALLLTVYGLSLPAAQLLPAYRIPLLTALGLATLLAFAESLPGRLDDNLRIGLAFGSAWYLLGSS